MTSSSSFPLCHGKSSAPGTANVRAPVKLCTGHGGWSTMDHAPHGPWTCGLSPPYSQYKNNSVIPWKIQQFYKDTPQHHQFSISVQILNKLQLQPTILHLHPYLLHRSPPNIVYFLICHRIFTKYRFRSMNFNHSYLFNNNFESSDSCAKILRITSSFSLSNSYSYDHCSCVID
jgi:hypothetical protein